MVLASSPRVQQSNHQLGKVYFIAITFLLCAGLFIAAVIVLSLIPLYIPQKSATFQPVLSPLITFLYNLTHTHTLTVKLPIESLPPAALLVLQTDFQRKLDSDSQTSGTKIIVVSAKLAEVPFTKKKRRRQTTFIQLTVTVRLIYPQECITHPQQSRCLVTIVIVISAEGTVDIVALEAAILGSQTTATATTTEIGTTSVLSTSTTTEIGTTSVLSTSTTTEIGTTSELSTSTTTATTSTTSVLSTSTTTTTTTSTTSELSTSTTTTSTTSQPSTSTITTTFVTSTTEPVSFSTTPETTTTTFVTSTTEPVSFSTTTTFVTSTTEPVSFSTTTPFVTISGVTISFSANPQTTTIASQRRRRNFIQSTQITSYMPVGGCLIIGSQKDDINAAQHLHKQNAFFKHLPLGIEAMPAVDGQQINLYTLMQQNKILKATYNQLVIQDRLVNGHYLTLGALGCLEAHVRAWERVVEVNRPMLILEDDTHFDKQLFDHILPYVLYSLPTNFSLLYFGNIVGASMQPKLLDHNEFLWKVNGSNWGTYAYLISPQAAATLLDFIYPVYAQVDSMIIDIAQSQSLDVYISKQILVQTDNTYRRISRTQRYIIPPIIIPPIFHFIWLTNDSIPIAFQKNVELWKTFHPNWQIRLWTNESIYDSNLNIYNKYRLEHSARSLRQASDILRYEIIYQYGGIYVDVDFEPLKNIESLLHGVEAFVVHENSYFICNGIYGAIPAHELSERLVLQLEPNWKDYENATVNQQSGPYHMTKQVEEMRQEQKANMRNRFQIFAPHIFFPYAWYQNDPGHPYDPSAFTVHHFRSVAEIERNAIERS